MASSPDGDHLAQLWDGKTRTLAEASASDPLLEIIAPDPAQQARVAALVLRLARECASCHAWANAVVGQLAAD